MLCRFPRTHFACSTIALCIVSVAAAARGHESDADTRIEHLVPGDGYFVQVAPHGVEQVVSGDLAKLSDHWIMLVSISSADRIEHGVPVLSHIPHINRLFKNVGIGRSQEDVWIPRDAATIRGRIRRLKAAPLEPPAGDEPPMRVDCHITSIGGDSKLVERDGKLTAIAADRLTLLVTETVNVEVRKPGWSSLPLVGGYFIDTRQEMHQSFIDIPAGDIASVRFRSSCSLSLDDQASLRQ